MALKVSCPNCLSLLQVPGKLRGKVVVCPCCKEKCQVPLPSTVGVPRAGVLVQPGAVAEAHATAYDPSRGSWIRTAVIASIAAAVVAVGGLILSTVTDFGRNALKNQENTGGNGDVVPNNNGQSSPVVVEPQGNSGLAAQAEQVLRTHCYRCHGQEGVAEGGFNFVLRRERLVSDHQYINPGKPDESFLLSRISKEEMPPAGETRPTKEEVDVLRRWIADGAPDFAAPLSRPFLSNTDLVRFIRQDLENNVPSRQHQHTRYFTLVNLFNAGFSDDEMETYRLALSKLVNSLSWHNKVVPPRPIDPHKTIFRVDVRDLGWDDGVWEAIIDANPYSVKMNDDDLDTKFCLSATHCQIPHVRGDWFVAAASRPPLYHTVLQVPGTMKELLKQRFPGIDLEKDIKQESVVRVGFGRSGVSTHNRLLEWHHSPHGYFWVSYDFGADVGRKNLLQHPMGPGTSAGDFEHDGGEIIFSLPNGLQGYMLVDAAGKRIDKGPTNIVSDPKRPDRAVTNGVSCMSCHYGGIIRKDDEVRKVVEANRTSFKSNYEEILALYKPQKESDELFEENATRFLKAVHEAGIKEVTETGEPIVNMAQRFETEVDVRSAAAELGLKLEDFLISLKNPRVADVLGPLNVPGGTVKRDLFAKEFVSVVEELRLGTRVKRGPKAPEVTVSSKPDPVTPVTPPVTPGTPVTPTVNPALRVWRDVRNNTSIEAEFVNLDGQKVELRKADNTAAQIAFANLSPDDRKFVEKQMADRTEGPLPLGGPDNGPGGPNPPGPPGPPQPGPVAPAAPVRLWRNLSPYSPHEKVNASFVSLIKGLIKLNLADRKGISITWPMQDLAPEDHEYVKKLVGEGHYEKHKELPDGVPRPPNPSY